MLGGGKCPPETGHVSSKVGHRRGGDHAPSSPSIHERRLSSWGGGAHAGGEFRDSSGQATSAMVHMLVTPFAAPASLRAARERENGAPVPPAPSTRCRVGGKGGRGGRGGKLKGALALQLEGFSPSPTSACRRACHPSGRTACRGAGAGAFACGPTGRTARTPPRVAKRGSPLISVCLQRLCARAGATASPRPAAGGTPSSRQF